MNMDRFNEGPPALDRQHPEEREPERDKDKPFCKRCGERLRGINDGELCGLCADKNVNG